MIAFDTGAIRDRDDFFEEGTYVDLMGWAVGTRIIAQHYDLNLTYARPIDDPNFLGARQEQWHFSLNFKI